MLLPYVVHGSRSTTWCMDVCRNESHNHLRWSKHTITWSRADHPDHVEHPGLLALIVAPQVEGYELKKVLMDGGSSINILYWETFLRMRLKGSQLQKTSTVFHGIVPGKSATPLGKITLEVAFGESRENFRSEMLDFEVVDFHSPYHALLGRPAYARFMVRPCYVYLQMKIPGPKGIITVHGNMEIVSKLSPPWEGPFIVSKNLHSGSYYLVDAREHSETVNDITRSTFLMQERERPWNIAHLRPYYT